jgi:3-isopropylmalate/(R)-2-methylmalate dehydratase small subunit
VEQLTVAEGIAAPLLHINIDTDQITPGKELVRMRSEGAAPSLFAYWRYIGDREPNPNFILNREPWNKARILLADRNFGCGSSRETAPMALRAWGFRAVIAPSFGGIFYNNCFRNGLLPVELPIEDIKEIAAQMESAQGHARTIVDLENQTVTAPDGTAFSFRTPSVLRDMLLLGIDEIDLTLRRQREIEVFRAGDRARRPWAYRTA